METTMRRIDDTLRTLIVVCGPNSVGKTTVATALGKALDLHVLDVDRVVETCFGFPPGERNSEEYRAAERRYWGAGYRTLLHAIGGQLSTMQGSIIVTAPFSSKEHGQQKLMNLARFHDVRLKTVWLSGDIEKLSDAELQAQLDQRRKDDGGYKGAVESVQFLRQLHRKFEPIEIPDARKILAWPMQNREQTLAEALAYCLEK